MCCSLKTESCIFKLKIYLRCCVAFWKTQHEQLNPNLNAGWFDVIMLAMILNTKSCIFKFMLLIEQQNETINHKFNDGCFDFIMLDMVLKNKTCILKVEIT